jgi:hypothetical protein
MTTSQEQQGQQQPFSREAVKSASSPEQQLPYTKLVRAFEPYASFLRTDFHQGSKGGLGITQNEIDKLKDSPTPGLDLNDPALFYNSEEGGKKEYWADKNLPVPTKDLVQLRKDLVKWGYCLVAEALSPSQLEAVRTRIYEQADGERLAGVAAFSASPPPPGKSVSP